MERIKMSIPLNILIAFTLMFSLCLWGQEKPTDQELQQLRAVKTAQVLLEENYGNAKNVKLPIEKTLEKLLLPAGIKQVESGADVIVYVKLNGRALSRRYSRFGFRIGGEIGYTGARISGTVYLKKSERPFFKKSFSGSVSPASTIIKGMYKTPSSAPFKSAFAKSSFRKQVIIMLSAVNKNKNALFALYLKSDDQLIRKEAAILLGDADASDDTVVDSLAAALEDKSPVVRIEAAKSLGKLGDPDAIEPLLNRLPDSDSDVRQAALKALDNINPDWRESSACKNVIPSFLVALKDKKSGIRKQTIEVFGEIYHQPAQKLLIDALKDPDLSIREAALKSLGERYQDWGSSEEAGKQVPFFINELKSHSAKKRRHAVRVLAGVKDPRCVPALIETLKDNDKNVLWTTIFALGRMNDPAAVPSLIALLEHKDSFIKVSAVSALGKLNTPDSIEVDALIRVLADKDFFVRARSMAARVLGEKDDERVIEPLIAALRDESADVNMAAIHALVKRKEPRVVRPLVDIFKRSELQATRDSLKVGKSAYKALEKIDDLLIVEPMAELLKERDFTLRNSAKKRLEKIKDPRALDVLVDILIGYLQGGHIETRETVIQMLKTLKDERAVGPLVEILKSPDERERRRARYALKSITGKDYGENYKKWKKWWNKKQK